MSQPPSPPGNPGRRRRWPWLVAWGILTVLVVLAFRDLAWDQAAAALREARPGWLLAAVLANALILPLSARQWQVFLPAGRTVGFRTMLWIHAVTSTVSNGGPFLAGHAAGIHLLATRGGTGHATGVSVKALDQLAEGLAKLALVGTVVLLAPLPSPLRATALGLAVGVPVLGAILLVAAHRGHLLDRATAGGPEWWRAGAGFLAEVAVQLETLRRPGAFVGGVALALAQKVAEGLAIACVVGALGLTVPFWAVLLTLTAVNLSTMASVTPANLGIYEGSAMAAWMVAGLPTEVALGLAVLQHLAYLLPLAGAGWAVLAVSGLQPGEVLASEVAPDPEPSGTRAG